MTDTTDIKALPKMTLDDLLIRCTDYDDGSLSMDAGELKMLNQHISLLEAERQRVVELEEHSKKLYEGFHQERQRADEYKGQLELEQHHSKTLSGTVDIVDGQRDHWMERARKAEAEIAALKGDQVPVATMHRLVNHRTNQEHPWVCSLGDVKASEGDIFRVEVKPLFPAPQKPVISKEKLCDWLEDNFDIDDSQRDAFAACFAHCCDCIVKDGQS